MVIDISETRCTLRWEESADDGGADVKHYVLEYFRDVWNVWLKAMTTKECQAVIDDLIPGSRYCCIQPINFRMEKNLRQFVIINSFE